MIEIKGKVVPGKGEARQLGYPTANIEYSSSLSPEAGVWVCRIEGKGNGLAVMGMWLQANGLPSLEVHILDFEGNLYEQELEVTLEKKIRDLMPFTNGNDLVKQIENDVQQAREYFG